MGYREDIQAEEDLRFIQLINRAILATAREERYNRRLRKLRRRLLGLLEWRMRQIWRTSWDHIRSDNFSDDEDSDPA